jgi:EAL domain-containing protein (putative c-di-GMP-specific phosphodiesterase class I)
MPTHPERTTPTRSVRAVRPQFEQELRFVTEPIVDLASGTVLAHEVLARPCNGATFPAWFDQVPGAFAGEVWWCALRHALPLLDQGITAHVNICASQLARPTLVAGLKARLTAAQLSHLVIEVTEREPVRPSLGLRDNLAALRRAAVTVALDDFGEGHADLAGLQVLTPTIVKVSLPVVAPAPVSAGRAESFLDMCRSLGVQRTVVERIETPAQLEWAQRAGFDAGQGFYWGSCDLPSP